MCTIKAKGEGCNVASGGVRNRRQDFLTSSMYMETTLQVMISDSVHILAFYIIFLEMDLYRAIQDLLILMAQLLALNLSQ